MVNSYHKADVELLVRSQARDFLGRRVNVGVRISDYGQPGRHSVAGETNSMPRLCWRVYDVALAGDDDRQRPDLVLHLALQNEPEFGAGYMKMPFVFISRRRLRFGVASDDVSDAMSVADKLILILFWLRVPSDRFVVVDEGHVRLIVDSFHVRYPRPDKLHARDRCWRLIDRIHRVRIC